MTEWKTTTLSKQSSEQFLLLSNPHFKSSLLRQALCIFGNSEFHSLYFPYFLDSITVIKTLSRKRYHFYNSVSFQLSSSLFVTHLRPSKGAFSVGKKSLKSFACFLVSTWPGYSSSSSAWYMYSYTREEEESLGQNQFEIAFE